MLSLKRKKVPPSDVKEPEGRDPTLEVARYLREHVRELGECAPAAGGELRVHLEVTVAPGGGIERVRIMNLEPLPSSVSECVEKGVRAFNPPGFDASKAETFALTVVL